MANNYYKPGSWNAICDICGFEFKAEELKKQWDGIMVCERDWSPRHPQDFVHGVKDKQNVPWTKEEGPDTFTAIAQALTPHT